MIAIHNMDILVQRQPCADRPMGSMTHDSLEIAKALCALQRPSLQFLPLPCLSLDVL